MAIAEITPQLLDVKVPVGSSGVVIPAPRTSGEVTAPNRSHFGDRLLAGLPACCYLRCYPCFS